MKRLVLGGLMVLALAACKEETTAEETTSSEAVTQTETAATADDGAGAMDGAAQESTPAAASMSEVSQDAIDACIDTLRTEVNGGGTILSTEFSEANSLVMLEDANGGEWKCLVGNDGVDPYLEAVGGMPVEEPMDADDGAGAMDGAAVIETEGGSNVSQDAIDACIDTLRAEVNGGGTILSTEFSEANSLVMLEDANGGEWKCLVGNDGVDPYLEAVGGMPVEEPMDADDGAGAMDGAAVIETEGGSNVSQDAIDACIDSLMSMEGSIGGTVMSTEFSEANSLVMLQDGNGNGWKCLVSNDGSNASVEAAQ
ncbi:hypothetical protein [Celeribacter sp. PS-C1]|uniref:hypothetical protein n=1 Tax=Celeribacter sp. PS-C1 TaxID=2820813 RepID=UPI001CA53403|nr:hypothetical protein [Celeribacter sp. PS-C1]MBW6419689.1 hypothetical protein [Celeribacter sp. PS-C1]